MNSLKFKCSSQNDSAALHNLKILSHLSGLQRDELGALIHNYPCLFGDVPSCIDWVEHEIDAGDAQPIKQHSD